MAIAYADRVHAPGFDLEFWCRRFARIAPLYYLSLLPFIPLVLARRVPLDLNLFAPVLGVGASVTLGFAVSALFVQTWIFLGIEEHQGINNPLWTICSLALGYAAFPSLARRLVAPRSCTQMACSLMWLLVLYLALTSAAFFGLYQYGRWAVPYCARERLCEWHWCNLEECADMAHSDGDVLEGAFSLAYSATHQTHWVRRCLSISRPLGFPLSGGGSSRWAVTLFTLRLHDRDSPPQNKLPLFAMGMVVGLRAVANARLSSPTDARQPSADDRQASADVSRPPPSSEDSPPAHHRCSDELWCNLCSLAVLLTQLGPIGLSPGANFVVHRVVYELGLSPLLAAWLYLITQAPNAAACRMLCWRPLRTIGAWSYGIYCLHWPVLEYYCWGRVGSRWLDQRSATHVLTPWDALPAAALVLGASALAHYTIEQPCRNALQSWLLPRGRPTAQSKHDEPAAATVATVATTEDAPGTPYSYRPLALSKLTHNAAMWLTQRRLASGMRVADSPSRVTSLIKEAPPSATDVPTQLGAPADAPSADVPSGDGSAPAAHRGTLDGRCPVADVVPWAGRAVVFPHRILHESLPIVEGRKLVVRGDVLYAPTSEEPAAAEVRAPSPLAVVS
jgi:peptidoglycan/LPS O-acetylase OafA/YrhL